MKKLSYCLKVLRNGLIRDSLSSDIAVRGRPGFRFKLPEDGDFDLWNIKNMAFSYFNIDTDVISQKSHNLQMAV